MGTVIMHPKGDKTSVKFVHLPVAKAIFWAKINAFLLTIVLLKLFNIITWTF